MPLQRLCGIFVSAAATVALYVVTTRSVWPLLAPSSSPTLSTSPSRPMVSPNRTNPHHPAVMPSCNISVPHDNPPVQLQLPLINALPLLVEHIRVFAEHDIFRQRWVYNGRPAKMFDPDEVTHAHAPASQPNVVAYTPSGESHRHHDEHRPLQDQNREYGSSSDLPSNTPAQPFAHSLFDDNFQFMLTVDIDRALCSDLINYIQQSRHYHQTDADSDEAEATASRLIANCASTHRSLHRAASAALLSTGPHKAFCRATEARVGAVYLELQDLVDDLLVEKPPCDHAKHENDGRDSCGGPTRNNTRLVSALHRIHDIFFSGTSRIATLRPFSHLRWTLLVQAGTSAARSHHSRFAPNDRDLDLGILRAELVYVEFELAAAIAIIDDSLIPIAEAYLAGHIQGEVPWYQQHLSVLHRIFFPNVYTADAIRNARTRDSTKNKSFSSSDSWQVTTDVATLRAAMARLVAPTARLAQARDLLTATRSAIKSLSALERERRRVGVELARAAAQGFVTPLPPLAGTLVQETRIGEFVVNDIEAFANAMKVAATKMVLTCRDVDMWEFVLANKGQWLDNVVPFRH